MKTRSIAVSVIIAGLFSLSWFAARSRAQWAEDVEHANRERSADDAKLQLASKRRAAALEQRSAAEKELASLLRTSVPSTTGSSSSMNSAPRRVPTIAERLRTEPDAQVLWLKLQQSRANTIYGPLFRRLGLTSAQISQFEDNVFHNEEQQMDLQAIATEEKKSSGNVSAETNEALQRVETDYNAEQRTLLGDSAFQQLEDYEKTSRVRNWVDGWAGGATVLIGEPMRPEQGEQLVQIISNATSNDRRSGDASHRVDWNTVDIEAQRILTPKQFRLFTTTEPPLPMGGRFQSELYDRFSAASAVEAKSMAPK